MDAQGVPERGEKREQIVLCTLPAAGPSRLSAGCRLEAGPGGGVVGVAPQELYMSLCLLDVYSMSTSRLDVSMCLYVYYVLVFY